MKGIKLLLSICFIVTSLFTQAQRVKPIAKFKPPVLVTMIGNFKDTMQISKEDADALIAMPLKITDKKGVPYILSSYQFLYRKIVTTEDEQTGKPSNTTSVKSSLFTTSPVPPIWISAIRENIRSGEEFIFFDVIAKDAKGRVMFAPNIKLTVK